MQFVRTCLDEQQCSDAVVTVVYNAKRRAVPYFTAPQRALAKHELWIPTVERLEYLCCDVTIIAQQHSIAAGRAMAECS